MLSYWAYIHLCLVTNNQRHYIYFFIIIDRLGYMSTLTYWSFCFLYFFICFSMRRKSVMNMFLSLLSYEFEQFGSLHMCVPRKDIGRRGTRACYPLS